MKKFLIIIAFTLSGFMVFADDFPYQVNQPTSEQDFVNSNDSAIKQIGETYVGENTLNEDTPATSYISKVINYFLAITGFIAFLTLAYGFVLVFTDKTDEGIKKGYKFIKLASIAIIIIGISWLISIWFINIYTTKVVN